MSKEYFVKNWRYMEFERGLLADIYYPVEIDDGVNAEKAFAPFETTDDIAVAKTWGPCSRAKVFIRTGLTEAEIQKEINMGPT